MALALASGAMGAVGKGLGLLKDTVAAGAEVAMGAGEDAGEAVADAVGDAAEETTDLVGDFARSFSSRRRLAVTLTHRVEVPQLLLYAFSASGVVAFFAAFGRTLCCCFWPLECCGAAFARAFNACRRRLLPCMNEFKFLTITVDRVLVHQVQPQVGASQRPGDLQVAVRFGQVWPLGSFSMVKTVPAGSKMQPVELPPLKLQGGSLSFEMRKSQLPRGHQVFCLDEEVEQSSSELQWVARRWFALDTGLVPSGWWLKKIMVLEGGLWRQKFPPAAPAGKAAHVPGGKLKQGLREHGKHFAQVGEVDPNAVLKEARENEQAMRMRFEGENEGSAEWPEAPSDDRGRSGDAMTFACPGAEEDLVLVIHVLLEKQALEEASEQVKLPSRSLLQSITTAVEDAEDGAVSFFCRDNSYELARCCLVEIFPRHIGAGPFQASFRCGQRNLLQVFAEVQVTRLLGKPIVHLRKLRVEVVRDRGPIKGLVKAVGFVVPRAAVVNPGHPEALMPSTETSRMDIYHGTAPESKLQFTVPLRPGDVDLWLQVSPKLSFVERLSKALERAPLVGGGVQWLSGGDTAGDELFRGEVHFQVSPSDKGASIAYAARGSAPVKLRALDMKPPGTVQQRALVTAPRSAAQRCVYGLDFRLMMSEEGRGQVGSYAFPANPQPQVVFAWGLSLITVLAALFGVMGMCSTSCHFLEDGALKEQLSVPVCEHEVWGGSVGGNHSLGGNESQELQDCIASFCKDREEGMGLVFLLMAGFHACILLIVCADKRTYRLATFVVLGVNVLASAAAVLVVCLRVFDGAKAVFDLFSLLEDSAFRAFGKGRAFQAAMALRLMLNPIRVISLMRGTVWIFYALLTAMFPVVLLTNMDVLFEGVKRAEKVERDNRFELKVRSAMVDEERASSLSLLGKRAKAKEAFSFLSVMTCQGGGSWEDGEGRHYFAEALDVYHGTGPGVFVTKGDFHLALQGLKREGLLDKSDHHAEQLLFNELCDARAEGLQKLAEGSMRQLVRQDLFSLHEEVAGIHGWREERLDKQSFLSHWLVEGREANPCVSDFLMGMQDVKHHRQTSATGEGQAEETALAQGEAAWQSLADYNSVQRLMNSWQKFTPAFGKERMLMRVELQGDTELLMQAELTVEVKIRFVTQPKGKLKHSQPLWDPAGSRLCCCCSLPKTWCLDFDFADGERELVDTSISFDEYSVKFSLAPVQKLATSKLSHRGKWRPRVLERLESVCIGWCLVMDPGSERIDEGLAHLMPSEAQEAKESVCHLRYFQDVSAVMMDVDSEEEDEDEYQALANISSGPVVGWAAHGREEQWWSVSPRKLLLQQLCLKHSRAPASAIAVDITEILESYHEKSTGSRSVIKRQVSLTLSAKELLGVSGTPFFVQIFGSSSDYFKAKLPMATSTAEGAQMRVAPGWALERMEVARQKGVRCQPWHAQNRWDPLRWLSSVASEHGGDADVTLLGQRRIFLDVCGQFFQLYPSVGQLDGAEQVEALGEGMSPPEFNHMMLTISKSMRAGKQGRFQIKVHLSSSADVALLSSARDGSSLRLLQNGQVLPMGASVEHIASLELAKELPLPSFLGELEKKGGMHLLPAQAALKVPLTRLRQVPGDRKMLPLHLMLLGSCHGYRLTHGEAVEALKTLAMGDKTGEAQQKALSCLCHGEPLPVTLRCYHETDARFVGAPPKTLELLMPDGLLSTISHGGSTRFQCHCCLKLLGRDTHRYHCPSCRVVICADCSEEVSRVKDELRILHNEVRHEPGMGLEKCKKLVGASLTSAGLAPSRSSKLQGMEAFAEAMTRGQQDFAEALDRFLPVKRQQQLCGSCGKEMAWKSWRFRLLSLGSVCCKCEEPVSGSEPQWYCGGCGRILCMRCAGQAGPRKSSFQRKQEAAARQPESA